MIFVAVALLVNATLVRAEPASREEVAQIRNICSEILTNPEPVTYVDVVGAPGMRVVETREFGRGITYDALFRRAKASNNTAFYPHELVSSRRYAALISSRRNETLHLVPGVDGMSVPGFDGVIINSRGDAIANYSLKTLVTAHSDSAIADRAHEGVSKARRFSTWDQWFEAGAILERDADGDLHLNRDISLAELDHEKHFLKKTFKIFGINSMKRISRPTRIVIDIQSRDIPMPSLRVQWKLRRMVRKANGLIDAIIVMKGPKAVVIR